MLGDDQDDVMMEDVNESEESREIKSKKSKSSKSAKIDQNKDRTISDDSDED